MIGLRKLAINIYMVASLASASSLLQADSGSTAKQPVTAKQEEIVKKQVDVMAMSVEKAGTACERGVYIFCEMAAQQSKPYAELLEQYEFNDPDLIAKSNRIVEIYKISSAKAAEYKAKIIKARQDKKDATSGK